MSLPKEKETSKTPAETVIGWLFVFFSVLVMALGYNNSQITTMFWVGVGIVPVGIICIILGKQKQKTQKSA
jgi:quinol-cytochrome oxidoreductase complex cytochrome b subunit